MIKREYRLKDGSVLPLLEFEIFKDLDFIKHGFTMRHGGVSKGHFSSMNLSFSRGDREEDVRENYKKIGEAFDVDLGDFVLSDQTHTVNTLLVKSEHKGMGIEKERSYHDIDGLLTDEKGIVLTGFFADCTPLFFVDPVKKVIAISHSGWKGTIGRIGEITVKRMCDEYDCNVQDILCAIGPSISRKNYEVDRKLGERFIEEFGESVVTRLYSDENPEMDDDKSLLDLWEANKNILLGAGILPEHIETARICTKENCEDFFSHRAFGDKRGNNTGMIMLI